MNTINCINFPLQIWERILAFFTFDVGRQILIVQMPYVTNLTVLQPTSQTGQVKKASKYSNGWQKHCHINISYFLTSERFAICGRRAWLRELEADLFSPVCSQILMSRSFKNLKPLCCSMNQSCPLAFCLWDKKIHPHGLSGLHSGLWPPRLLHDIHESLARYLDRNVNMVCAKSCRICEMWWKGEYAI